MSLDDKQPVPDYQLIDDQPPKRVFYFINEIVEDKIRMYTYTGCVSVSLRNSIMSHTVELIRQIIRKQGLHTICQGQEETSFNDLIQTAWLQIERVLYKFRARPHCRICFNPDRPNDSVLYEPAEFEYGIISFDEMRMKGIVKCNSCGTVISDMPIVEARQDVYGGSESVLFRGISKVFNLLSQVARTVILAYIKKEGRDRKNASSYRDHVIRKLKYDIVPDIERESRCGIKPAAIQLSDIMIRFLSEAREICKYNNEHLLILNALENLLKVDDKLSDGIVGKLSDHSGLSRASVVSFMRAIRLRSFEFTDSPITKAENDHRFDKRKIYNGNVYDDDDE